MDKDKTKLINALFGELKKPVASSKNPTSNGLGLMPLPSMWALTICSTDFSLALPIIYLSLPGLSKNPDDNSKIESEVKLKVKALCDKFPIYSQAI